MNNYHPTDSDSEDWLAELSSFEPVPPKADQSLLVDSLRRANYESQVERAKRTSTMRRGTGALLLVVASLLLLLGGWFLLPNWPSTSDSLAEIEGPEVAKDDVSASVAAADTPTVGSHGTDTAIAPEADRAVADAATEVTFQATDDISTDALEDELQGLLVSMKVRARSRRSVDAYGHLDSRLLAAESLALLSSEAQPGAKSHTDSIVRYFADTPAALRLSKSDKP